jgi:hypothetical protein
VKTIISNKIVALDRGITALASALTSNMQEEEVMFSFYTSVNETLKI